jgi:tRNA(fMet)-specific endonuclease VapC
VKYVLDTNTLSFAIAGKPSVSERLLSQAPADLFLPQPVIAEIEYGLARLPKSKRKARLRTRFQVFLDELQRVLWTDEISLAFGQIKADLERRGIRIEDFDVAIAAHALALNATLVTDNLDHMGRVPNLRLENWHVRSAN